MENLLIQKEFVRNVASKKGKSKVPMFGIELNNFMETQKKEMPQFLNVPLLIRICGDEIITRGLELEGLFRVPGNSNVIQEICKAFEEGNPIDLSAMSIEDISGAYKRYMRELPHPLFSDDGETREMKAIEKLIKSVLDNPLSEQIRILKSTVSQLSFFRRTLAFEFFYLLYLVSLQAEKNFMTATNLATIFGGMINIISSTLSGTAKTDICCLLISHFPEIFCDEPFENNNNENNNIVSEKTQNSSSETKKAIKFYSLNGSYTCIVVNNTNTVSHLRKSLSQSSLDYSLYYLSDRHLVKLNENELLLSNQSESSELIWANKFPSNESQLYLLNSEKTLFHGKAFIFKNDFENENKDSLENNNNNSNNNNKDNQKNEENNNNQNNNNEKDGEKVLFSEEVIQEFSLVCLSLQKMLSKINLFLLSARDELSVAKFTALKEALEKAKTLSPAEKPAGRAAAARGRGAAWMLLRTAITEIVNHVLKRVNSLLNTCSLVTCDEIEMTMLSLEGLSIYNVLLAPFLEYQQNNSTKSEKNVLNVEIIEAKDVLLEESQIPQIALLLDEEQIGKTRACKQLKNGPLQLTWNENFEIQISKSNENIKLKLFEYQSQLCMGELTTSIEDIAVGTLQESWLAFFPEGFSKIGNSLVHISTTFSISQYNVHVGNLKLTVIKCTNTHATECTVTLIQPQTAIPTEFSNIKKGRIEGQDTLWDETFSFNVDRAKISKSEVIIAFKKNKKVISESRLSLSSIIDNAEEIIPSEQSGEDLSKKSENEFKQKETDIKSKEESEFSFPDTSQYSPRGERAFKMGDKSRSQIGNNRSIPLEWMKSEPTTTTPQTPTTTPQTLTTSTPTTTPTTSTMVSPTESLATMTSSSSRPPSTTSSTPSEIASLTIDLNETTPQTSTTTSTSTTTPTSSSSSTTSTAPLSPRDIPRGKSNESIDNNNNDNNNNKKSPLPDLTEPPKRAQSSDLKTACTTNMRVRNGSIDMNVISSRAVMSSSAGDEMHVSGGGRRESIDSTSISNSQSSPVFNNNISSNSSMGDNGVRIPLKSRPSQSKMNGIIKKRPEKIKTQLFSFRLYPIPPKNLGLVKVSLSHTNLTILPIHSYQPFIKALCQNIDSIIPTLEFLADSNIELKRIISIIVPVFYSEGILQSFIEDLIATEANIHGNQLLAGDTPLTFVLDSFIKLYCQNYISKLLSPLQKILESENSCQLGGKLMGDEYKKNMHFLTSSLKSLWSEVINHSSLIPPTVRKVFFALKNVLSPGYNDNAFFSSFGNLFINRYIGQVIANPKKYGLGDTLDLHETYNLGIISNVISHLGSFHPFPSGNPLIATNVWLNQTFPVCQHFLDQISTPSMTPQLERVSVEIDDCVAEVASFFIVHQEKLGAGKTMNEDSLTSFSQTIKDLSKLM